MERKISILGFAGSLRKGSYNKALLRAAVEMAPAHAIIEAFDLEGIPPFNQDIENDPPQKVKEFKEKIRAADAILIATPEYNFSVAGVLKNAIDWASRPDSDNVWTGKPVAIMSASIGMFGGARAQYHLRQVLLGAGANAMSRYPEVMVAKAQEKIDRGGKLTDEKTREKIRQLLDALVVWAGKLQR